VQSAALRIVSIAKRQIEAFVPVEYWSVEADLKQQNQPNRSFSGPR